MPSSEIVQPHPDTIIWRYINYDKLINLAFTRCLFFAQAKQFHDQHEGSPAMLDLGSVEGSLKSALKAMYHAPNGPRAYTTVSCWSMNNYQSTQMWDTLKNDGQYRGVVLQSTVGHLRASILDYDKLKIVSGAVNYYVRPAPEPSPKGDNAGLNMFFHKRPEFADEREYRLLCERHSLTGTGFLVQVDIEALIQKVYTPSKVAVNYVSNMILRGLNISVERTTLFDSPP